MPINSPFNLRPSFQQRFVLSFATWMGLIWLFAPIALTVASTRKAAPDFGHAFRFAAYGVTPFLVFGMLSVIPLPYVATIADAIALPWAFYVLSVGVVPMLGIPEDRAPAAVGLLTGALLIGGGVMPALLRMALQSLGKA